MERRTSQAGFSLIELMAVVAILGLLAAIAIPSYLSFLRRAKAGEAMNAVGSMYQLAAAYYVQTYPLDRALDAESFTHCVVDSEGPVPGPPSPAKHVVRWADHPSFAALGYDVDAPIQYPLEIVSLGGCNQEPDRPLYSFRAHGDLDGDGETSLFEVSAGSGGSNQLLRSPGIYMRDREE